MLIQYKDKIIEGKFISRYKRFFAEIKLGKEVVTAYCPNTGSLLGLLNKGSKALVAKVENSKAKLKYRLEAIKNQKTYVGINTSLPNNIIFKAMKEKKILQEIKGDLKKEVKYGKNSRVDIFASHPSGDTYIEVKSVTLSRKKDLAEFPDAVTSRGSKHLIELSNMSEKGSKCFLIYLIQRNDVDTFSIAKDLDNEYYENSLIAKKSGVKFRAFKCDVSVKGINIVSEINIDEN